MPDIVVDTYKLRNYAERIFDVNRRINHLDRRLDSLYIKVGLQGLFDLMQADALTGYSWRLLQCQSYLQETATMFEQVERHIKFNLEMTLVYSPLIQILENLAIIDKDTFNNNPTSDFWDFIKDEISDIPEDIKSAGEALAWLEKQYEKFPHCVTHGVDLLIDLMVPETLKDAYILTSELFQGDLTLDEVWDVAKNILSLDSNLAVICEAIDYTFEIGIKREKEMMKQMYEQLGEGDILGVMFEGAEGFIDTIIGGVIDIFGDVVGNEVDKRIDNIPVLKGINIITEYGTGLLGCNEGEGYSIGGLIGAATEGISNRIDDATDVITDATNVITDAITDGFKNGIKWVTSWFD